MDEEDEVLALVDPVDEALVDGVDDVVDEADALESDDEDDEDDEDDAVSFLSAEPAAAGADEPEPLAGARESVL